MEQEQKKKKYLINPLLDWNTGMDVEVMDTYIRTHLDEKLTPKSIIDHFDMDYQYARNRFYLYHGEHMTSYIRRLRKERAKETEAQGEKS